jgi:hypothetical protein
MNLNQDEGTALRRAVAASPKADDTELSDEALDRVPGKGVACWAACPSCRPTRSAPVLPR